MRPILLFAVCFTIIFCSATGTVEGRLFVQSPEEMIKNAPYIIVGKVKAQRASKGGSKTTVGVEKILKGSLPEEKITIVQPRVPKFEFSTLPQPETRVMLFLQKAENRDYALYADLNNVGIVDLNNTVKLYKGARAINQKTPKDYELVYTTFLFQTYDTEKKLVEYKDTKEAPEFPTGLLLGLILIFITVGILKFKRR